MAESLFSRVTAAPSIHVRMLDAHDAIKRRAKGELTIIDVREADEREAVRIPGSISMPLSSFDPAAVPIEEGKELMFHCASGSRCGVAAQRMRWAGFTGPLNRLTGGLSEWVRAGGPVRH